MTLGFYMTRFSICRDRHDHVAQCCSAWLVESRVSLLALLPMLRSAALASLLCLALAQEEVRLEGEDGYIYG